MWSRFEDERQEREHNSRCRVPKDRSEVPRFADVPSAQGRWRWRRTVLEVSGVWGLGALELHGGGESMRGMNRVGDGVEETVGWDNRRRLCSQSLSPRPDTQSHAHFLFKHDEVFVVSRSGIFKLIRNSRYRVLNSFWNSSLSSLSSSFTFNDILHSVSMMVDI